MGGGILLLAVMASYIPPKELIPIHGLVQLASNSSRTILSLNAVDKSIWLLFSFGALVGASAGSFFVVSLPEREFRLVLATFILVMTWIPMPKKVPRLPYKFFYLGIFGTFLSLFVGATGPLLAPFFIHENLTKRTLVATKAACQICVHTMKLGVYFYLGFALGDYWPLVTAMTVAVFFGNWVGKYCMELFSERAFMQVFRTVVTLLALRMVGMALGFW